MRRNRVISRKTKFIFYKFMNKVLLKHILTQLKYLYLKLFLEWMSQYYQVLIWGSLQGFVFISWYHSE